MSALIILYLLYCFVTWWAYHVEGDKILYPNGKTGNLFAWNARHLFGIILLFIFPLTNDPSCFIPFQAGTYSITVLASIVVVGYGLLNLSLITGLYLPQPAVGYPFSEERYRLSIMLRAIFLGCYEFYFRGLLLFGLAVDTGFISASLISTALYTISHFGDKRKELVATIPFGLFLCWVTIESNAVLPAILLHWLIALPIEVIASKKITQPQTRQL